MVSPASEPTVAQYDEWLARESLADFCARMDPTYETAPHIALLIEHLEALERRDLQKLMVFLPPRHSKTYHVSERLPAWWLGRRPTEHVILASYGSDLSQKNSRMVRTLMEDERFPFPAVATQRDLRAVSRWQTTLGGGILAAGVGGPITGHGADLMDIDDPFKDRMEADSEVTRERVWVWYQDVARTRLAPGAVQLLTQTRWHEDDLAGRILNSGIGPEWTVIALPALALADDPLGREPGQALWPSRYPVSALPSPAKGEMSLRSFTAMYQQQPSALEGTLFKRKDIQRWHTLPPDQAEAPKRWTVVLSVDAAWKEGAGNDFSVIATWATDGIDFYLLHVWRQQVEYPDLKKAIQHEFKACRWQPKAVLVEDAAAGIAAVQELRRTSNLPVIPITPRGSKENRADAVSPLFEAHKVYVPDQGDWVDGWIEEHVSFPTAAHDDQVDTTTQALARLGARDRIRDVPMETVRGGQPEPTYPKGSFREREQKRARPTGRSRPARSG